MASAPGQPSGNSAAGSQSGERPWIGIRFDCCGVYRRLYLTADGGAFAGNCPRCARPARVRVAAGGSSNRFFRAG